jgi:hypothetical protein
MAAHSTHPSRRGQAAAPQDEVGGAALTVTQDLGGRFSENSLMLSLISALRMLSQATGGWRVI